MAWEPRIQDPQRLLILMVNGIENILECQLHRDVSVGCTIQDTAGSLEFWPNQCFYWWIKTLNKVLVGGAAMKGRSLLNDVCCWVLPQESACCWYCPLPNILLCLLLAHALIINYIASASKPGSISIFPPSTCCCKVLSQWWRVKHTGLIS